MLKDLKDLFIEINNMIANVNISSAPNMINFDWWDFIIKLVIAILLWIILKAYFNLKRDFDILNILYSIRNRKYFLNEYKDWEFYRMPNETDEDFFKRTPKGLYIDELKKEYYYMKKILMEKFDLNPSKVTDILDKIYGLKKENKHSKIGIP